VTSWTRKDLHNHKALAGRRHVQHDEIAPGEYAIDLGGAMACKYPGGNLAEVGLLSHLLPTEARTTIAVS
jgi:hypothetical protein